MGRPWQRRIVTALIVLACGGAPAGAADWYVSPTGTGGGNGSMASPWNLQTALNQPAIVHAGDTLWLRGGTYNGMFTSRLNGTAASPITVRSYPHEWAVLKGTPVNNQLETLQVGGSYTWFRSFEITSAGTDRESTEITSWPDDIDYAGGLEAGNNPGEGVGCKAIDLVIHDTSQGLSLWKYATGFETVGCLIFHNGWDAPDRGHGHGMYVQNNTPVMRFSDNIVYSGFSYGTHAYGSSDAYINNFTFEYNTWFDVGVLSAVSGGDAVLIGGGRPSENIIFNGNLAYCRGGNDGAGVCLGHGSAATPNANMEVRNNYIACTLKINRWSSIIFRNNTGVGPRALIYPLNTSDLAAVPPYDWNFNTYWCSETPDAWSTYKPFNRYKAGAFNTWQNWTEWRSATGYDPNSTYTKAYPASAAIFVRKNDYDTSRGRITVFNWPRTGTVNVDISPVIAPGQRYALLDAQNYFGPPVATGTYAGGTIVVPMTGAACAQPTGNGSKSYTHTSTEFGVFVVVDALAENRTPTAGAGPDINLLYTGGATTVSLDGTISDDGLPGAVTQTWSKISGPGTVSFANANAVDTAATFSTQGTYVLRLTATDTALTVYDECTVSVRSNFPPQVSAGPDIAFIFPGVVPLDGTVTDDGLPGPAVSQTWSCTSGPGTVTFADPHSVDTTATFSGPGTYVLRLTATDTALSAFDEVTIKARTDTLLMRLPLDEGAGTAAGDDTGSGHNGTLINGPTWVGGPLGQAVHFDEMDDHIRVADFAYGPQFSISFWFKPDDNAGSFYQYIYSHGTASALNSLNIFIAEQGEPSVGGKFRTSLRDIDDAADNLSLDFPAPIDGRWHLYTLTVGPGEGSIVFLDGNQVASDLSRGGASINPATDLYLAGRCDLHADRFYGGGLDDVRVYGAALTAAQVAALYAANLAPTAWAGADMKVMLPTALTLAGSISDDGQPSPPGACAAAWSTLSGPGTITFGNAAAASTTATFSTAGTYVLRLTASDSVQSAADDLTVTVLKPGDFTGDGRVDGLDFLNWQSHYPNFVGGATPDGGDGNGDGKVDGLDFLVWQSNYGG